MIFLLSGFLHESKGPSPLSKSPKYFQKYFGFRKDIHKNICKPLGNFTWMLKKWSLDDPILFLLQIMNKAIYQSHIGDFCLYIQF